MIARLSAFLVWGLLGLAIVYWGMALGLRSPAVPTQATAVADAAAPRSDLSRLLGVTPAQGSAVPTPDEARFKLMGLVAPKRVDGHEQEGVALISVDGGPPMTVRVGALVDKDRGLQLLSIAGNGVNIGRDGTTAFVLNLAPLLPAQGVATPSQPPATYALAAPMMQPAPPMVVQQDPSAVPGMMPPATLPPQRPPSGQGVQPNQVPPPGPNSLPLR